MDIDKIKKLNSPRVKARSRATSDVKYCLNNCNSAISWCHAIAKNTQLKSIANGKDEVCWLPNRPEDHFTYSPYWSKRKTESVLTFKGFCGDCDNRLFKSIDDLLVVSSENCALLALRSSCYQLWRAKVDARFEEIEIQEFENLSNQPDMPNLRVQDPEITQGQRPPTNYFERDTKQLLKEVQNLNHNCIQSAVFDISSNSSQFRFSLSHTFALNLRNNTEDISYYKSKEKPSMYLHLLEAQGAMKLILSWKKGLPTQMIQGWINQIQSFSLSGHLKDVLLRYMFLNNHGLVFSEQFEETLTHEQSAFLTAQLASTIYTGIKQEITRIANPPYFLDKWEVTNLQFV